MKAFLGGTAPGDRQQVMRRDHALLQLLRYRTYCGSDPVRNYLETGDLIGKRPGNDF